MIASATATLASRQAVSVKIGCTGGNGTQCHVQLQLLLPKAGHGPVLLGSASFVLGAGATEAVKVPLNRAGGPRSPVRRAGASTCGPARRLPQTPR